MNKNVDKNAFKRRESLFSIASLGFFLIVWGAIFACTPELYGQIVGFFKDLTIVAVLNTQIYLPVPASPETHITIYSTVRAFCLIWGIYETIILIIRFVAHSPPDRKAETLSSMVFWLGAAYLINGFLNEATTTTLWFAFWALIIALIGVTLIVRGIALAILVLWKRT